MSRAASESWLACPEKVRPIDDLRRPEAERESWAPPKIKKREAVVLAEKGGDDSAPSKELEDLTQRLNDELDGGWGLEATTGEYLGAGNRETQGDGTPPKSDDRCTTTDVTPDQNNTNDHIDEINSQSQSTASPQ